MKKITQYLNRFLEKTALQEQLINKNDFISLWNKVAGKHIADYTRPVMFKENKLFVEVTDSTWLFHLTLLKSKIIDNLNAAAGSVQISDLKFLNADFRSAEYPQKYSKPVKKKDPCNESEKALVMEPAEEEKLKEAVLLSPEIFQKRLCALLKNSCLYQKWRGEKNIVT